VQFTRVLTLTTAMSLVVVAAACSTATRAQRTGASPAAPSASGTPGAATPSVATAPSEQSPAAAAARPRVLAGGAPRAAGFEVTVRRLQTSRPGGRVTGLSAAGVAVGMEGRRGAAASAPDGERAVRWDADGQPKPLAATAPGTEPKIGPDGLVAVTAPRSGLRTALDDATRLLADVTARTADGRRPENPDVGAVVDVGTDQVLVALRRPRPAPQGEGDEAPPALWSPRTGELRPVPIAGRFLTDDGGVVGNLLTGVTDEHPEGSAPAIWRAGEQPVKLQVPRGWRGEPKGGVRDTVVGKLTRTTTDGGTSAGAAGAAAVEQPPAAAVQWRKGKLAYLPPLGGRQSIAASVNGHGVAAGTSQTPDGWPHAVTWRDGHVTDLGTLDGTGESWAVDISDGDVAVGYSSTKAGGRHAVAWVGGGILDLGAAVDPAATSQAAGIVGRRIYGTVSGKDGVDAPVIWTLRPTKPTG
jgi:probable HAF family extracellular repeat protein